MNILISGLTVDLLTIGVIGLALLYRARVEMPRPPIGVFQRSDIITMIIALVVMPYAYLHLPVPLVVTLFGLTMSGMIHLSLAPLLGGRPALLATAGLAATAVVSDLAGWHHSLLVVNDLMLLLVVVGVTNMWSRTGITPGHVTGLAAALAVYDLLATGMSSTTATFVSHIVAKPFAPLLAAGTGTSPTFIGMGDCLLLAVWPLAVADAFPRKAVVTAVGFDIAVLAGILAGFLTHTLSGTVPLATPLGVAIVGQYLFWRGRSRRQEAAGALLPVRRALEAELLAFHTA
jgi:hypothetical protein